MGHTEPRRATQSISQLTRNANTYLRLSIAPSTSRNYNSAVSAYERFCSHLHLRPFPPTETVLIWYATHTASFSSHANVKVHMAAIKHFSIVRGDSVQFRDFDRLYLVIRGIKRSQGTSRSLPKRLPITPSLLRVINQNLFNSLRLYEDKVMLWTAIITAFFGFLRISEYTSSHTTRFDTMTTLMLSDVSIRNDHAHLHIKASKTDPFRQGVTVRIAANNTILCPINALRLFLPLHPTQSGPLFAFQSGKYLTRSHMNRLLKDTTNNTANISSHSLRIGAASTAAAMGCPKYLIQGMGRWSSDCFRRYIRISDRTIRTASRALARCSIPIPIDFDPRT